jgi:hypothetical protein
LAQREDVKNGTKEIRFRQVSTADIPERSTGYQSHW